MILSYGIKSNFHSYSDEDYSFARVVNVIRIACSLVFYLNVSLLECGNMGVNGSIIQRVSFHP